MKRVFITGYAALAGDQKSLESIWECQISGRKIPDRCLPIDELIALSDIDHDDASILSDYQVMALASVNIAWKQAGLPEYRNRLRTFSNRISDNRIGCVSGSVLGGIVALTHDLETSFSKFPRYSMSRWRGNGVSSVVSEIYGLSGPTYSINAASATGGQAIVLAANMIKQGVIDAAVVVASEPRISPPVFRALKNTGAISLNEAVPLSIDRSGMRPVPGTSCLILENEERVIERKIARCVEWIDGASGTEVYHLLAPHPTGERLSQLLLSIFGKVDPMKKSEIDWVSLHATGTIKFDPIELKTVSEFFWPHKPWLSAFKRTNGHLLAASGIIDAALLAYGINREEVPPWPRQTDPALKLETLKPSNPPTPKNAIMISQGMGGNIAVNIFGKYKH